MVLVGVHFSFRHWRHLGDSPFPAKGEGGVVRGCVTFEFPGRFCRLFYFFFGVRGASSKTIKTGLNCWKDKKNWNKIRIPAVIRHKTCNLIT